MERFVDWGGHRTWCEVTGDLTAGSTPLILLHGGPGLPSSYLEPLLDLSGPGRPVIRYDQLGCGNSAADELDSTLWVMQTFVDELTAVVTGLELERFHLFGHSWGGWLALEYVLQGRPAPIGLVLASTCPSLPAFANVTRRLKAELPAQVQQTLDRHEAEGTTDSDEYMAAFMEYATRWLIRSEIPDYLMASVGGQNEEIYGVMQGPEWNVTGNIKDWDVTNRLGEIRVPVLVTSGRHDEMTEELVEPLVTGLADSRWVRFDESAHMAFIEERDRYREVVGQFLDSLDRSAHVTA